MAKYRWNYYTKENRDRLYYAYLNPKQKKFEKILNGFYIGLMIFTFVAAIIIALLSRVHIEMTFIGLVISEICLVVLRHGTIPLYDIQFIDHKKEPEVTLRENMVVVTVGICFMLFIGYVMMYVGLHEFFYELARQAAMK